MGLKVEYEPHENWVAVRLFGSCPVSEITGHFAKMIEQCRVNNTHRLLIDFTEVEMPGATLDRYELGNSASIFAKSGIKIATVATPVQLTPERFGALVARNRGVNVTAFDDFGQAHAWLIDSVVANDGNREAT